MVALPNPGVAVAGHGSTGRAGIRPVVAWTVAGILLALALAAATGAWRLWPSTPGDASAEAGFARDMRAHHEQAVEMAFIARERTDDPLIAGLANDIVLTQLPQMGQMFGWLSLWGLPAAGTEAPMAWMGHAIEGRMPGMASPEELDNLRSLFGVEADREFLRLMIRHHEGGVPMAEAILERSDEEPVRVLANAISTSQQGEVDVMTAMLAERGGQPAEAAGTNPGIAPAEHSDEGH